MKKNAAAVSLGRKGGKASGKVWTPAKKNAARKNGRKGGRPRNDERILFRALKSLLNLIGEEDLPDNGELSGAAVCDFARAIADSYERGDRKALAEMAALKEGE
jgi:general stress protein YciG